MIRDATITVSVAAPPPLTRQDDLVEDASAAFWRPSMTAREPQRISTYQKQPGQHMKCGNKQYRGTAVRESLVQQVARIEDLCHALVNVPKRPGSWSYI